MRREDKERTKRSTRTLYEILQIPPDAPMDVVRKAYLALARRLHPDAPGGSDAAFQDIQRAYTTLNDEQLRAAYDREISGLDDSEEQRLSAHVESMLTGLLGAVIQDTNFDPNTTNMVRKMVGMIDVNLAKGDEVIEEYNRRRRRAATMYRRMKSKSGGRSLPRDVLLGQIMSINALLQQIVFERRAMQSMRKMLLTNGYDFDKPPMPRSSSGVWINMYG